MYQSILVRTIPFTIFIKIKKMEKERKFTYISKENIDRVEAVRKKYATTFSAALNILLTEQNKK
jgi:hypothetical protein